MVSRCLNLHLPPHPLTTLPSPINHNPRPKSSPPLLILAATSNTNSNHQSITNPTPQLHHHRLHASPATHVHRNPIINNNNRIPKFPITRVMASSSDPDNNNTTNTTRSAAAGDSTLTNDDLKPTTPDQRIFSWWEMASLWIGLVVGVPSYYLAGSLVDLGMSWWQGIATVVTANLILLVPLILTGEPGTRYGISFPVLARSCFGIRGAHVPTLLRALVGCGWYGIESWIGGEAIYLLLPQSIKSHTSLTQTLPYLGTSPLEFACFIAFWFAQLAIVLRGIEGIKTLEKYSAPILIFLTGCLLSWSYINAGGFSHMLSLSSRLTTPEFLALFFPSLTANISFWIPLALNIPDFTRYAKSQTDQVIGQIGLPIFMGLFTFVGLAVTSSTKVIFGHLISNPIQLLGQIGGPITVTLSILGIGLATVTTNIAANVVAPANALVNLSPSTFTFRRGAMLTALLGIAFQPWRLLQSSESFVYTWLVGYAALLGPIGGVMLVDYYLVKRMRLCLKDLYSVDPSGEYYYSGGFNVIALVALAAGMLPVVPGLLNKVGVLGLVPDLWIKIYENAWFFSFFLSGFVYWVLCLLCNKGKGEDDETAAARLEFKPLL